MLKITIAGYIAVDTLLKLLVVLWNLMLTLNGVNGGRACALVLRYVIDDVMSARASRSQLSIARSV